MQIGKEAGLKPADQLRDYFGAALLEICKINPKIVVLDGDLGNSTRTHSVKRFFPDRFFNLGIAESNLVSVGAGLASCGFIPFITSFPCFLLCNAYDQIRLSISIPKLNVKLVGSHGGISTNREGPSTMSIEDFALAGALPGFVILVPGDPISMQQAVLASVKHEGPVYIRTSRMTVPYIYSQENCPFEIGKANIVMEGGDVTIIGCGIMTAVALDAATILKKEGIQARVLDMHSIKPIDKQAIISAARETGAIVTAEEHLLYGGMGSIVASVVAEEDPVSMCFVGINDTYVESGTIFELMEKYGLSSNHIVQAAKKVLKLKTKKKKRKKNAER